MEFAGSPETARPAPEPDIGWTGAIALAVVLLYSLPFIAVGGYVFYASIRPVTLATGYGAGFLVFPWLLAWVLLLAAWVGGPAILLVSGLIHLLRHARHRWWSAASWLILLAAGAAVGYLIIHDYRLLFRAAPIGPDGSESGPSRWAPGAPYWQALFAAGGQLAVSAVMTAVITAPLRTKPRRESLDQQPADAGGPCNPSR
jgi:hypothetical protein